MRLLLLLAVLSGAASAQISVMYKPISLRATESAPVGIGKLSLVNRGATVTISRAEIMMALPEILDIPNDLAAAALTRKQNRDRNRAIVLLIRAGSAAAAIAFKDPRWALASPGVDVISDLFAKQAFDPAPLLARLLPDTVTLPDGSGAEFTIVTGLMHNVKPVGPVLIPARAVPSTITLTPAATTP